MVEETHGWIGLVASATGFASISDPPHHWYGRRVKIGLVGCGRWGKHILRDLVALGCDVTVVARSTVSRERASSGGATRIVSHPATTHR